MAIRIVRGKLAYRFQIHGQVYTASTRLVAEAGIARECKHYEKAVQIEARARTLVEDGRQNELKVRIATFDQAADQFLAWAKGEHRNHPNTYLRLVGSFSSLRDFFGSLPVYKISAGRIEDFKTFRRVDEQVKEVTIRHDLHSLSSFLRYARKQKWIKGNPLEDVKIPSDADAVRIHPLTPAEETLYFETARLKGLWDLHDLGRLMILQGPRPEEMLSLAQDAVSLEAGTLQIRKGKTNAAKRTLYLTAESREILARRLQQGGKWVFPSKRKRGAHVVTVQQQHEAVLEATGLSFVVYDLRHTFATRAATRVSVPTLAAILGHNGLRCVMRYVHVQQDEIKRASLSMDVAVEAEQAVAGRIQ
jgi:integrase